MALMKFREPNQVQWRGMRPAHNGTEVHGAGGTAVIGIVNILPAHASLTQYVHYYSVSLIPGLPQTATLEYATGAGVAIWVFALIYETVGGERIPLVGNFWPPLEVLPTNQILLRLTAASWAQASVLAWRE